MNILVNILRNAEHTRVLTDPAMVLYTAYETKENAYGVLIPDISKTPTVIELGPVMIVPVQKPEVQNNNGEDVSAWINDFLLVGEYTMSWIQRGLVIGHNARKYRILEPVYITRYDEIIAIHAHLDDVTDNQGDISASVVLSAGTLAPFVIGG